MFYPNIAFVANSKCSDVGGTANTFYDDNIMNYQYDILSDKSVVRNQCGVIYENL